MNIAAFFNVIVPTSSLAPVQIIWTPRQKRMKGGESDNDIGPTGSRDSND